MLYLLVQHAEYYNQWNENMIEFKEYSARPSHSQKKAKYILHKTVNAVFCAIFIFSSILLVSEAVISYKEDKRLSDLALEVESSIEAENFTAADFDSTLKPTEMLVKYKSLYEKNPDIKGWIKIDGTAVDYPVMYSGDNFYLEHNFDKEYYKSGLPYIDSRCSAEAESTNTIIYGHNQKNGIIFAELMNYTNKDYYEKHPLIRFDTLSTEQEYEIIAVFLSEVYKADDDVYKYYNFIDALNEEDFNRFIENVKSLSLYDTKAEASYGDKLVTLITCAYHKDNGRFTVVARKK